MSAIDHDALDKLAEAFQEWGEGHGIVWFDADTKLAEAVAAVLGIDLKWNDGEAHA